MDAHHVVNQEIARRLREVADLLEEQDAGPFRVNAYRRAAGTIEGQREDLRDLIAREGPQALEELPGIGRGIASAIREMLTTGRWGRLEQLRGAADPVRAFRRIPGIGPHLAKRIYDRLGVESLEALELAAHDGRLATVPGFGPRRLATVRAALAATLGRRRDRRRIEQPSEPGVAELLELDAMYRERAERGELPRVAPRRFNPEGEAWLPVMHTERHGWYYTVLYSNTPRAHELGRTRDWVVIYFHDDDDLEGQCTVVTETTGPLKGLRVVRGRETECAGHYAGAPKPPFAMPPDETALPRRT